MGPLRADDPRVKELENEQRAWNHALCDLGLECVPGSAREKHDCAYRGYCDDPLADERLRKMKEELAAAIRNRDWARLGL